MVSNGSRTVRRLSAILLFAALLLPLGVPLLALGQGTGAGLPACCRRTGAHHCAMDAAERLALQGNDPQSPRWQPPAGRCPYAPALLPTAHVDRLALPPAQAVCAAFLSGPAVVGHAEPRRRVLHDRSRPKRGPPASLLV